MSCLHIKVDKVNKSIRTYFTIGDILKANIKCLNTFYTMNIKDLSHRLIIKCDIICIEE